MNIKSLHLRNIASIEAADIDFARDLTDGVTGEPASVFLISGDTGAGKSVILDGISMALYKTTPRLSGTANKTNNTFSESSGEKVSINSIDQYTRLGISERDESYSELVFEGNDGVEYVARLTLGMYMGNRDKDTGKRRLKHRKPSWSLTANGTTLTRDSDIEEAVARAVGLSFEQFGRMAMLAQGQFATFLTGDKKERESILEQLTNTAHFTDFGRAIKSLHDSYAAAYKEAVAVHKAEAEHSLTQERLDELNKGRSEAEAEKTKIEAELKAIEETMALVALIEAARKNLAEAQQAKALLEEKMAGEEYKASAALARDWKATAEARRLLADMRKAAEARAKAAEKEEALREMFGALYSDLLYRQSQAEAKAESIGRLAKWVKERSDRDGIYGEASATVLKINGYIKAGEDMSDNGRKVQEARAKSPELELALAQAQKKARDASEAVDAKQREINALTACRQKLEPAKTNSLLDEANADRTRLAGMQSALKNIAAATRKESALETRISQGTTRLAELEKVRKKAQEVHDAAAKACEASGSALLTMETSRSKDMTRLRAQLVARHAETCPLCGQHIASISGDEDFKALLSSLQTSMEEARQALDKAKKALDEASSSYSRASGEVDVQRKALDEVRAEIGDMKQALALAASEVQLDISQEPEKRIAEAVEALDSRIDELKERQGQAEELQQNIDRLLKEKESLDEAKGEAIEAGNTARKAVDDNKSELTRLAETAAKLADERCRLADEISQAMAAAYPAWADDAEAALNRLKADAGEYNGRKSSLAADKSLLEIELKDIESIGSQCTAVLDKHAEWKEVSEPAAFITDDILGDWRRLVAEVQATASKIEGYDASLKEWGEALEAFCDESGKSQAELEAVEARAGDIEDVQELLRQTEADLKSRSDAMAAARDSIAESMAALGADGDDDIPLRENLEREKAASAACKDAVVGRLSSIATEREADNRNRERVAEAEKEMKKAEASHSKWRRLNELFGGTRLRTLVQTYILRPLLNNANIYLERITDRYVLTCSEDNEQLSILVLDRYNKNQVRSATLLSGGEKFMVSLALSLALSSLNRPDMNVDILFIDEGFGTLGAESLEAVMQTLERLPDIAGEGRRRVGIISHRQELDERIPVQIRILKKGEGRSAVSVKNGCSAS